MNKGHTRTVRRTLESLGLMSGIFDADNRKLDAKAETYCCRGMFCLARQIWTKTTAIQRIELLLRFVYTYLSL